MNEFDQMSERAATLEALLTSTQRKLADLKALNVIAKIEVETHGHVTPATCASATSTIQKIERRLTRALGGIFRLHEQAEKYSEGNKEWP